MGSLTIALIVAGWCITTLLVLRLFSAPSRDDSDDAEDATEEGYPERQRRFEPRRDESASDVATRKSA